MTNRIVRFAHYSFWLIDQRTSGTISGTLKKTRRSLHLKAELSYLEIHLTDHCNLNCKGCAHFCPLAEKWFADPASFSHDMLQLKKLFSNIKVIRLMGGEPLLHPKLEFFLNFARSCFPKADIRLVTNGILLNQRTSSFWTACKANSIVIDITIYPTFRNKEPFFVNLANSKGVIVHTLRSKNFFGIYNENGNSDILVSFKNCVMKTPNLREGKLYPCPFSVYSKNFNRHFGTEIPMPNPINIYLPELSGWTVTDLLNEAPSTCCYCALGWDAIPLFPWSESKRNLSEWVATKDKSAKNWFVNPLANKKT